MWSSVVGTLPRRLVESSRNLHHSIVSAVVLLLLLLIVDASTNSSQPTHDATTTPGCNIVRFASASRKEHEYFAVVIPASQASLTRRRYAPPKVAFAQQRPSNNLMLGVYSEPRVQEWDLAMMPFRFNTTRAMLEAEMVELAEAVCRYQDQNLHRVAFEEQGDDDDALFLSPLTSDALCLAPAGETAGVAPTLKLGPYDAIDLSNEALVIPRIGLVLERNTTRESAASCETLRCLAAAAVLVLQARNGTSAVAEHMTAVGPFMQVFEARASDQYIDALLSELSIHIHELNFTAPALETSRVEPPSQQLLTSLRALLHDSTEPTTLPAGTVVLLPAASHWHLSSLLAHLVVQPSTSTPLECNLTLSVTASMCSLGAQRHSLRVYPATEQHSQSWPTLLIVALFVTLVVVVAVCVFTTRRAKAKQQ